MDKQPYVVLTLKSLFLKKCATRDEFLDAILSLKRQNIDFVPLKYHAGTDSYFVMEVVDD
jgi:hypothetical protein